MKGLIIILGNTNNSEGQLSETAVGRLEQGIKTSHQYPQYQIAVTGGFGHNFNTTDKPHTFYLKEYLIDRGIKEDKIIMLDQSTTTITDALLSKDVVEKLKVEKLIVISSDFHMRRVKYVFGKVFTGYDVEFVGVKTDLADDFTEEWKKEVDELIK